jgi:hypothetical protein
MVFVIAGIIGLVLYNMAKNAGMNPLLWAAIGFFTCGWGLLAFFLVLWTKKYIK